jgi:hypothetical protein
VTGPGVERQLLAGRQTGRHLAIVSLPFYRIARVSLSRAVLSTLTEAADVVIVAPFAEEEPFRRNFARPGIDFVRWVHPSLGRVKRALLALSEILRRNGYWRRFRCRHTGYYVYNQFRVYGYDGDDTRLGAAWRAVYWILSVIGESPHAWRIVDRLLGSEWASLQTLEAQAACYENVTLIQSANWGVQDRALSSLARRHGWRSVLLPYTTDQLDVNGYLLNVFDSVLVQGSYELDLAKRIHGLEDSRIVRLGSAWFRHLDLFAHECAQPVHDTGFVLYAGVSSLYFPRESEFHAVDAVLDHMRKQHPGMKLIYRPVELDPQRRVEICSKFEGVSDIELQWPPDAQLAMDGYSEVPQEEALRAYIRDLAGCKVLVMSNCTSLALDVAYLTKCGVVANRADALGVLDKRGTELLNMAVLPGLCIVQTIPDLLQALDRFLADRNACERQAAQITGAWDYAAQNFYDCLQRTVLGEQMAGEAV